MRFIVSFFCALVICSGAIANELVVGEQGSVTITLPNQPNDQKCNIEVKFADGSSQDIEVDPKNLSKSISFTPTIAGTQIIQWDGKMKWRGLKSRPPCAGDGRVSVTVRERAEVLAEREAEAERLRAEQAAEAERLKQERDRQTLANLLAQLDTDEKKQCAFVWIKAVSSKPERYSKTDALSWASTLMDRYVTGTNPVNITPKTIKGFERMLATCDQFFSKERQWRSQTFEPPTGDISCTLGSGAKSTCYWTYRIYVNDAWRDGTPLQAMQAHITSGEKFWATALPEKPDAKALREKCELNVLSDEGCPGYAEAIAKKEQEAKLKAEEEARLARCGTEPLISTKCPGYKEAKAKQDAELARQRAEEEKRKEEKLARQRAEEEKDRKRIAEEQRRKQERLARQRAEEEKERKRIAKERTSMKSIFDDLPPQEATRALAHCFAYYIQVKGGLGAQEAKFSELSKKTNVRSNFRAIGKNWILTYVMADKEEATKQAHEACDLAGIPR